MFFLYNLVLIFVGFALQVVAFFSPKIRIFIDGRKRVFAVLEETIKLGDKTLWFHAASLGEYEQGLPVIQKFKEKYPGHKIVLTFFSPSGFEVRKNNTIADATVYLPLDTRKNVRRFLELVHPEMAFFIKYDYWPNYLNGLKKQHVPTYLISGIFRESQVFFQWYGGFYRQALDAFRYFFLQNISSKELLKAWGYTNVAVSGDTRFDRVAAILEKDNALDFISKFKKETITIVVGSSWPKDEKLLAGYINETTNKVKFIVAPHNIKPEQIAALKNDINKKTILFSEKEGQPLGDFDVMIIDTIGILTKIYSYADIAYVGGGFGNPGVHNLLEPATFGVPIVIGPNYSHFAEARALVKNGGCLSIDNQQALNEAFDELLQNEDIRNEKGHICSTFVQMNKNATDSIMKHFSNGHDL